MGKVFVETFGSEGGDLIMWLVVRCAINKNVKVKHTHYQLPASMTGAGCVVLENACGLFSHAWPAPLGYG
jgi:protocatechuate 4,5-dioxygenase, beta chain